VATLAAEPTIGIACGLFLFIEAIDHIGFRVVLFDPSQNMFGIERDAIGFRNFPALEFGANQPDTIGQEKLQSRIGELAQQLVPMLTGGQTGQEGWSNFNLITPKRSGTVENANGPRVKA
jgi:hypothetical protein